MRTLVPVSSVRILIRSVSTRGSLFRCQITLGLGSPVTEHSNFASSPSAISKSLRSLTNFGALSAASGPRAVNWKKKKFQYSLFIFVTAYLFLRCYWGVKNTFFLCFWYESKRLRQKYLLKTNFMFLRTRFLLPSINIFQVKLFVLKISINFLKFKYI